jgi:glycosyltransferase 2 family protein
MWLIATFLFVVLIRGVDVDRVWALGQEVHGGWIAAAIASNLLVLPFWAQQWRVLLPPSTPVRMRRMLSVAAQLAFLGNAVPASGQVSAVVLLAREPGVTRSAALSGLALEQVTEGIVKVAALVLAAELLPLPMWMHSALIALSGAVAVLTVVVVLAAVHHDRIDAINAHERSPLVGRVVSVAARWSRDLESIRRPSRFGIALACSAGTKTVEALALVAVQHAFGLALPFSTTMLVLAASILGTIAPLAPANLGIYEGAVVAAYRHAGVAPEAALALAVVSHVCLLLATAAVGYVVFSVDRFAKAPA